MWKGVVVLALVFALGVFGPVPFGTSGTPQPQKGTYAGGGNHTDDPNNWVQVGLIFKQGTIHHEMGIARYPGGCSGGWSISESAAVDGNGRFDLMQFGHRIRGRFVRDNLIKGTIWVNLTVTSCAGLHKYKFKARRYGGA